MSLIAIGDIHGCIETLKVLIDQLKPTKEDHLIFIGDYIDRGPDSKGVIDFLLALRNTVKCTFLRGNHEALLLDYLDGDQSGTWEMNGGIQTMESYRAKRHFLPDHHERFIKETKLFHEEENFLFVHGGLKNYKSVKENLLYEDEQTFLWERSHFQGQHHNWEKVVVCGHTPHKEPFITEKLICIDTGCVFAHVEGFGTLTAIRLPELEIIEVEYIG